MRAALVILPFVLRDSRVASKIMQGITTELTGEASFTSAGGVRDNVISRADRAATDAELRRQITAARPGRPLRGPG